MSDVKTFTDEVRTVIQGFVLMIRVDKAWQLSFDFSRRGYATAMAAVFLSTLLLALLAVVVGANTMPTLFAMELIIALIAKYMVVRIYLEIVQKSTLFVPTFILMVWHTALMNGLNFDVFAILALVNAVGLPDTVSLFLIMLFFLPLLLLGLVLILRIFRLSAGTTGLGGFGLVVAIFIVQFLIASGVIPLLLPNEAAQVQGYWQMFGVDPDTLSVRLR